MQVQLYVLRVVVARRNILARRNPLLRRSRARIILSKAEDRRAEREREREEDCC